MTEAYSKTISSLRFPLVSFVILLHAYTSAKGTNLGNSYEYIVYLFALMLGEISVPAFFFISGFLFFNNRNGEINYKDKFKHRFFTLVIPYLLWNFFNLIFYSVIQNIPSFEGFFSGANKPVSDYSFIDYIGAFWDRCNYNNGNGVPMLQPFWYIRNLIILSLLSPLLYWVIKKIKLLFVLMVGIIWVMTPNQAFLSISIFFYSLGCYTQINSIDFISYIKKHTNAFNILFFLLACLDIITNRILSFEYGLFVHRFFLIVSVFMIFYYASMFKYKEHRVLSNSSFFIYAFHYPIILALSKIGFKLCYGHTSLSYISSFFITAILTIIISLLSFCIMSKCLPKTLKIITGNRVI